MLIAIFTFEILEAPIDFRNIITKKQYSRSGVENLRPV